MFSRLPVLLLVLLSLSVSAPYANAQDGQESNSLCAAAQAVDGTAPPWIVMGALEPDDTTTRVDFLTFTATPGTSLIADLRGSTSGAGSLPDPYLGLFDASCRLLAISDDYFSLDSHMEFDVPDDGTFILAAGACCDGQFDGSGGNPDGTYELTVEMAPPPIGAIEVTVVDSRSGEPVRGDQPPFASVTLFGCTANGFDCNRYYSDLNANSEGRLRFDAATIGRPLPAGSYRVEVRAEDYAGNESEPFPVAVDEVYELGEISLDPPALLVALDSDCGTLPPQGGLCAYTVRLLNNTSDPLRAMTWSPVSAYGIGSVNGQTRFLATVGHETADSVPTATARTITIGAGEESLVEFSFYVPSFVSLGASFCQAALVGLSPYPLMNTLIDRSLFCVEKRDFGFRSVVKDAAARKLATRSPDRKKGVW